MIGIPNRTDKTIRISGLSCDWGSKNNRLEQILQNPPGACGYGRRIESHIADQPPGTVAQLIPWWNQGWASL